MGLFDGRGLTTRAAEYGIVAAPLLGDQVVAGGGCRGRWRFGPAIVKGFRGLRIQRCAWNGVICKRWRGARDITSTWNPQPSTSDVVSLAGCRGARSGTSGPDLV